MNAESPKNLDWFVAAFKDTQSYELAIGEFPETGQIQDTHPFGAILKHSLIVRQASEVGPNDPEIVALDSARG